MAQQLEGRLWALVETAEREVWERIIEWTVLSHQGGRGRCGLASLVAQGKALASLLQHREGLSPSVGLPRITMDANAAEHILRGPAIARHTSFGLDGLDGARAAGLMFGVLGS